MDSELGIRDYGVLRACVGDGLVRAELLATARDRLPFGFYAVLRQVVKALQGAELHNAGMPHSDDVAASSASPGDVTLEGLVDVLLALFSGLSSELLMSVKRLGAMDGLKYEMPSSGDAVGNEMMMAEMDRPMENGETAGTPPPDADDSQPNLPVDLIKIESFGGDTEETPTPDVDDSQSNLPVEPFGAMTSQQIEDESCTLAVETAPALWAQDAIQNGEAAFTCTREYVSLPPTEGFSFESSVASRNGSPLAAVARSLTIGRSGSNNPGVWFAIAEPSWKNKNLLPGRVVQRPYHCDVCGHCFLKREHLKNHLRTHAGEKPYRCMVCGQTFSQQGNLKRHHRTHTGERPYGCEVCGREFSRSINMKMHMRTHTGENP
uniref:Zinc finger protein with KRAB and SCAN domains 3-like n=1 Tax=Petromyzon marinus TaxID=7757 RepID=A0AAJ7T553_PETMA|nr:zinc finger protein with KRAB and SCAN domains 3-like [Petromyzon marinus]